MSLPKHDDILTYENWIAYCKKNQNNEKVLNPKADGNKALSGALKDFHSDYKKDVSPAKMLETVNALQTAIDKYEKDFKGFGHLKIFTTLIAAPTARYKKLLNPG